MSSSNYNVLSWDEPSDQPKGTRGRHQPPPTPPVSYSPSYPNSVSSRPRGGRKSGSSARIEKETLMESVLGYVPSGSMAGDSVKKPKPEPLESSEWAENESIQNDEYSDAAEGDMGRKHRRGGRKGKMRVGKIQANQEFQMQKPERVASKVEESRVGDEEDVVKAVDDDTETEKGVDEEAEREADLEEDDDSEEEAEEEEDYDQEQLEKAKLQKPKLKGKAKEQAEPGPEKSRSRSRSSPTGIRAFNLKRIDEARNKRPVSVTVDRQKSGSTKEKESKKKKKKSAKNDDDTGSETGEDTETTTQHPLCIRLDLNVEIEIFLKAKIKGDVTITFFE